MAAIDELVDNNAVYARGFEGGLPGSPARGVVVVTCMDARLDVARMLGLAEGDAHVIRNAGAAVTDDVIRSLAVSQRLIGTREVMLISHTDCRMRTFSDDEFRADLERETGSRPGWEPEEFRDPDLDVRRALTRVKDSPFVPYTDAVRAFVLDLETGQLREVAPG